MAWFERAWGGISRCGRRCVLSRRRAAWAIVAALPVTMGQTCGLPTGGGGGPPAALAGVWRTSFVDPIAGPASVELILMQTGEFLQQTAYQSGALVTIYGTYSFPATGVLRLKIDRGEPEQFCGPVGCTKILYPVGETHNYTLVNATTLMLQLVNCDPTAGGVCTFTYTKVV